MGDRPLLSIIATSYNIESLGDVIELLDSIRAQSYDNIETIFVVERTTELYDRVKAYINENSVPNIKVVFNDGEPGLSAARNLGIKEASGDIIAFVNENVILDPEWAGQIVQTFRDESIIGVTGPCMPLWENPAMGWLPDEFTWILSCTSWFQSSQITEVRNLWGMNMSFRREAFIASGLFSTVIGAKEAGKGSGWKKITAEESELSLRIKKCTGKRMVYNPDVRLRQKVEKFKVSTPWIARKSWLIGCERGMLKRLYPTDDKGAGLLGTEHQLLRSIFNSFFPATFKLLFSKPAIAARRLLLVAVSLPLVALGYWSYLINPSHMREKQLQAEVMKGIRQEKWLT